MWEALMDKFEKQEKRIIAILGTKKLDVTRKTLKTYLEYLKKHVEILCQLTGIEDFEWEERYVFGFGSKKEYEKLKKTQPSYKDKFNLIKFLDDIDDEYDGIFVHVQRISDERKFVLPLSDLKSTDRKSKNYQLLDDYSVWFVNNR
ncbi:MAG: calcium-binding protein [Deltaproteobacteria bacterium]|nr:calcium-binding protein [Deltaproteobacteria bacterium]